VFRKKHNELLMRQLRQVFSGIQTGGRAEIGNEIARYL
jgi:hypothetical protein